jgi:hypothetical protein
VVLMGAFEAVVVGLFLVNLGVSAYLLRRVLAPAVMPFVKALGEKEGELIVLRETVGAARQIIAQLQAQVKAASEKVAG